MKLSYSIPAFLFTMAAIAVAMPSCDNNEHNDPYTPSRVDAAFDDALKEQFPDAQNVKWERNSEYRVAEFNKNGVGYDVWFDKTTAWAMTEMDYGKDIFLVPDNAVTAAFSKGEYGIWTIDDITHYKQEASEFYVFEVEKTGSADMDVFYTTDGTMIKAIPSDTASDILPTTSIL